MAHLTPHTFVPDFGLKVYGDDLHGIISFELQIDCMGFHLTPYFGQFRFHITPGLRSPQIFVHFRSNALPILGSAQVWKALRRMALAGNV